MIAYDNKDADGKTDYTNLHLGRFYWVYIGASCFGGVVAGTFYKTWLR